ncbi:MAG TPA: CoA-binding protein [Bryobacteraceae bacterium]|jgi:predicted CoA-binding protein|nr:CoA-binding protein [Bryobacteraceae bacterium]
MTDSEIKNLLESAKTIAVVGLSSNPMRPSFGVSRFLQRQGFRVIPVNPQETEVLGERAYASVKDVPGAIDIVDIFRRPARVPEVVDQVIERGDVRCVWMQEGVVSEEGAAKAEAARIPVVMDRCILKELARLLP